jgi:hypothetical protein
LKSDAAAASGISNPGSSKDALMKSLRFLAVAVSVATLLLAGCRVQEHNDGKKDNVAISTPFGSMNVKTSDNGSNPETGLTAYPGAIPVKDNDGSHDSANVNMSFGDFHLGVNVASYQTADSQDKVMAFYRKDMARYGTVIECQDNKPVGTPKQTSQGLTCMQQNSHTNIHAAAAIDEDNGLELRAGSPEREHIVGIESKDGGTRIGLVMLNLPSSLHSHDSKDEE